MFSGTLDLSLLFRCEAVNLDKKWYFLDIQCAIDALHMMLWYVGLHRANTVAWLGAVCFL